MFSGRVQKKVTNPGKGPLTNLFFGDGNLTQVPKYARISTFILLSLTSPEKIKMTGGTPEVRSVKI